MKRLIPFLFVIATCVGWVHGQQYALKSPSVNSVIESRGYIMQFAPPAMAAYVNAGSGWVPLTGTGSTGQLPFSPPAAALYVLNGSNAWIPWTGAGGGGGTGTVTSFSCVTANGVSCSVATATTTPAATFTLGAITPSSVTSTGAVTASSDGVHAGLMSLVGNTTNPTCPANQFCMIGFNSASATAYGLQPSTTAPVAGSIALVDAPSSGVSSLHYSTALPNGTTATTQTVGDNTTKVATTAFVLANAGGGGSGTIFSFAGTSATITASTTEYAPLTGDSNWTPNYYTPWSPLPACTAKNLYVVTQSTQDASGSLVVTLSYGATASDTIHLTTLTVTVAAGAAAGVYSDITHQPTTTAGYLYDVQIVNNATQASAGIAGITFTCG